MPKFDGTRLARCLAFEMHCVKRPLLHTARTKSRA